MNLERHGVRNGLSSTRGVLKASQMAKQTDPVLAFRTTEARSSLGELLLPLSDELMEALTAISNYLAASRLLIERSNPPAEANKILNALEKAHSQTARAGAALNRLRRLASAEGRKGGQDPPYY